MQFGEPERLVVSREMREHRNAADRAEEIVGEGGRRLRRDRGEASLDMIGAPADIVRIDVDAVEVGPAARQEPAGAPAAAAPVEHRPEARESDARKALRQHIELLRDRIPVEIEQELGFVAGNAQAPLRFGHRNLEQRIVKIPQRMKRLIGAE